MLKVFGVAIFFIAIAYRNARYSAKLDVQGNFQRGDPRNDPFH